MLSDSDINNLPIEQVLEITPTSTRGTIVDMKLTRTINCDHDHGILDLLRIQSWEVLFAQPLVRTVLPNMLRHKSKSARLQSATPKILWLCCRIILLLSFFWKWEITQTCVRRFYQQLTPLCNMLRSFCGLCCSNGSQSSGNDVYSDLFPIMFCISNRPTHVLWKSFQVRAFHELHTCADNWAGEISESNWGWGKEHLTVLSLKL